MKKPTRLPDFKKLLTQEMPQVEVARHFDSVKAWVRNAGYDVGSMRMPPIRVFTGLSRKDVISYVTAGRDFLMTKGFDMDRGQMEEHGHVRPPDAIPAFILGGPDGFTIFVNKGFGRRAIQHEMFHIFEAYLKLAPGALERKNLEMWRRDGVYFD
jgi:hypothetical protein